MVCLPTYSCPYGRPLCRYACRGNFTKMYTTRAELLHVCQHQISHLDFACGGVGWGLTQSQKALGCCSLDELERV